MNDTIKTLLNLFPKIMFLLVLIIATINMGQF